MTTVRLDQLEGLVSIPSFHAAGALIVAWAWRRHAWMFLPVASLNLLVVASTFVTGVHYFVDVLGGVVLFGFSVAVFRLAPYWLVGSVPDIP